MAKDGVFDELRLANKKLQITRKSMMACNMKTSLVNTIIYRICTRMFSIHKNITRKLYDLIYKKKFHYPKICYLLSKILKVKFRKKNKNFLFKIVVLNISLNNIKIL